MTKEYLAFSFDALMDNMKHGQLAVRAMENNLRKSKTELFEKIRGYNRMRLEFFETQMLIKKISWCTWCKQLFLKDQYELVLVVEREAVPCGYEGGDYKFKTHEQLHRVCPICKIEAYKKDGWYGPYDHTTHDQASYFAHKVEFRDGEYYQEAKKLEVKLPKMPQEIFDQLCKEWGIPAELGLNKKGDLKHKGDGEEIFVP